MKFKILQAVTGIKGQQPYIAFSVPGKEYDRINGYHGKDLRGYVVDIYKPKRSQQANAYMWALLQEIAEMIDLPAVEIYKDAVRDVGKYDDLEMDIDAVETFTKAWESRGIAWIVESDTAAGYSEAWVRVYYGSSAYNSAEMSRLIDHIVGIAQRYGIETLPPAELERLKGYMK